MVPQRRNEFEVLILAGGSGTRLWPLSRGNRPKQFLRLPHGQTLIEQAVERARWVTSEDRIWICTLANQVEETRRNLPDFNPSRIIAEPVGRNSGPAACTATLRIESERGGAPVTILMVTADHFIPDRKKYAPAVKIATERAAHGASIVTFGLKIRAPRTDYGYIEVKTGAARGRTRAVARFVEKPSYSVAKKFFRSSRHFWNSGMFAWRSDFFRAEMERLAPQIYKPLASGKVLESVYPELPNVSIDYALMERSRAIEVVPATFAWSDVGTWAAVYEAITAKPGANAFEGKGAAVDARGNLVVSRSKPVVLLGTRDLVVVETDEVTMVTTREASRDMKKFLKRLDEQKIIDIV